MTTFGQFDAFFNILILVTLISLVTWRLRFPPTIAYIIAGVLSSFYIRLELPDISPEIFVSLLLPPILFQEALHLDVDGLIEEADSILSFAILGTLIMQAIVAILAWSLLGFDALEALIFGILIAPTDPVAVIRVFKSLGVVNRFQVIVSGESLFNDGVAIVVYSILVSLITTGAITFREMGLITLVTIVGGIGIGLLGGYLVHTIFCWTEDKFAETLLSFIAAFGIFRLAEEVRASGVLAIVVAGVVINYRSRVFGGFSDDSFEMLEALWEFIGFLASSGAFIFIGMNLDQTVFVENATQSLVLLLLIITFRFIMVEGISTLLERTRGKEFPRNWRDGLVWSGLRGAISIVLVLGVARILPHGEVMIALTFGIVVLSNVLQPLGLTKEIVAGASEPDASGKRYVDIGQEITYRLCFDNRGNNSTVTTVTVVDTLPPELAFVRADGDRENGRYDPSTHTYTWTVDSLASGETMCVDLVAAVRDTASPGALIVNRASIDSEQTVAAETVLTDPQQWNIIMASAQQ